MNIPLPAYLSSPAPGQEPLNVQQQQHQNVQPAEPPQPQTIINHQTPILNPAPVSVLNPVQNAPPTGIVGVGPANSTQQPTQPPPTQVQAAQYVAVPVGQVGMSGNMASANREPDVDVICPMIAGFFIGTMTFVFGLLSLCALGRGNDSLSSSNKKRKMAFRRGLIFGIFAVTVPVITYLVFFIIVLRGTPSQI